MKLSDTFTIASDVISTEMDGESVLMHVQEGKYFSLNDTGSLVWQKLEKGSASLEDLVSLIMQDYDVEEDLCRRDLEKIIQQMVSQGVLEQEA